MKKLNNLRWVGNQQPADDLWMCICTACVRCMHLQMAQTPNDTKKASRSTCKKWSSLKRTRSTSVGNISCCNGMRDVEKVQFCVAASVTGHREMVLCKFFCVSARIERSMYCATGAAREKKNNRKQSVCMLMCLFVVVVVVVVAFGLARWSCERNYAHI